MLVNGSRFQCKWEELSIIGCRCFSCSFASGMQVLCFYLRNISLMIACDIFRPLTAVPFLHWKSLMQVCCPFLLFPCGVSIVCSSSHPRRDTILSLKCGWLCGKESICWSLSQWKMTDLSRHFALSRSLSKLFTNYWHPTWLKHSVFIWKSLSS